MHSLNLHENPMLCELRMRHLAPCAWECTHLQDLAVKGVKRVRHFLTRSHHQQGVSGFPDDVCFLKLHNWIEKVKKKTEPDKCSISRDETELDNFWSHKVRQNLALCCLAKQLTCAGPGSWLQGWSELCSMSYLLFFQFRRD